MSPEPLPAPPRRTQQFRPSPYLGTPSPISARMLPLHESRSRMVDEDAPTQSPRSEATEPPASLAPIMLDSTPPHAVDVWFAETPVRSVAPPHARTTMRTQQPPMSRDAQRGTRAAAFVGSFGAVAMAMFIWGVSAIAGTGTESNAAAAAPAPAESWVIPVMNLPVLAKSAESRAARAR